LYKWQQELALLDDKKEYLGVEAGGAGGKKTAKDKLKKKKGKTKTAKKSKDPNKQAKKKNNLPEQHQPTTNEPKKALHPPGEQRPADYDRDAVNSSNASKSTRMPEEVQSETVAVKARIAELDEHVPKVEKAYSVVEGRPANAHIHRRGEPKDLGEEVPRGFLTILGGQKLPADYKGSGRDYIANWIVEPNNPLTARVMVNRIWQYHFGKGIVPTPNDFGSRGEAPINPE